MKKQIEMQTAIQFLSDSFINQPVMMSHEKLSALMRVIDGVEGSFQMFFPEDLELSTVESVNSVAVIPIQGPLMRKDSFLTWMLGATSYEQIGAEFRAAIENPDINAILFDIDSPGGVVNGVFDLADEIYEARGTKPIIAFANDFACSAAYLLGSSADEFWVSRTSQVGSIGIVTTHVDESARDEKEGLKYTILTKGSTKKDCNPHEPLSESAKSRLESDMSDLYDLFCESVARNKDMSVKDIRKTEAAVYMGQNGIDVGLAEKLMSFKEALTAVLELSSSASGTTNTRSKKEVKGMNLAELKTSDPDGYKALMEEAKGSVEAAAKAKAEEDKQAALNAQKQEFESSSAELKQTVETMQATIEDQGKKIAEAEKTEAIRAQSELKAKAELIFTKALAASEIPEGMHEKVMKHVSHTDHKAEDGSFDSASFEEAVKAEIADWEGRGAKTNVMGLGTSVRTDNGGDSESLEAKADDEAVEEMLAMAGDTAAIKTE